MTADAIIAAFAEDESGELCDEVLGRLSLGMSLEWDCTLPQALELGFGGPELAIAARGV